jgi:transposase
MGRRRFGRKCKIGCVRLIKERGVSLAQAELDLDVHRNVLRKWVRGFASDPV